jgi:hypothetical protein
MPTPKAYQKLREQRDAGGGTTPAEEGGEVELEATDQFGPLCVLTVSHGGTAHRVELNGTVESLRFLDVLGALRHVRQRMPPNSIAKVVYRGKIRAPDTTLAQAGVLEGSKPKMILIAAQETPAAHTGAAAKEGATDPAATDDNATATQILGTGIRNWTSPTTTATENPATADSGSTGKAPALATPSADSTTLPRATIAPPDAIALYDFQPQRERQLKLSAGDLLDVLSSSADDWWLVRPYIHLGGSEDRAAGWVPASYVSVRPGWQQSITTNRAANSGGTLQRDAAIEQLTQRYQRERRELTSKLPRREAVYSHVAQYARADVRMAWRWVVSTLLLAASSSVLLVWLSGYWLAARQAEADGATPAGLGSGALMLLVIGSLLLAACSRVKLFIMFHDCTHNSMFGGASDGDSFESNERVGIICGALCHTSFSSWKMGHLYHHRHSNNLTHSQVSQSAFWTTRQYAAATPRERLLYHIQVGGTLHGKTALCWTLAKCVWYFLSWMQASWVTAYWFWQPCAMIFLARMISNRRENAIVAVLMTSFALMAVRPLFLSSASAKRC